MRSSKQRSRGKNNRNNNNRSMGNVTNRVFDSSGPEGKVRGTPQQVIDKYGQLASDATLANDRVAAENFMQHAEHYTRMLGAAQKEQEARREQQEREHRERQQNRDEQRNDQQPQKPARADETAAPAAPAPIAGDGDQPDVIEAASDNGLVETPEAKPKPQGRAPRKPRAPKPAPAANQADAAPQPAAEPSDPPEAAE